MSIFDGQAKLWDMVDGTEILTLADRSIPLDGVDFSPDGRYVTRPGPMAR
jgi:WD40 repeat protein